MAWGVWGEVSDTNCDALCLTPGSERLEGEEDPTFKICVLTCVCAHVSVCLCLRRYM